MEQYEVIPARPEHLPFLAGVERTAATVFAPGTIPDAIRDDSVPPDLLQNAMAGGCLWVALSAGGPVAGFALLREMDGLALLAELDVLPDHARKGLGRRLIGAAARKAREKGHGALYLTTFSHVPWNAPFYARLGFSLAAENAMPPLLESILAAERARGMRHRVAMRLVL